MGKYDFDFDLYEESPLSWIARCIKEKSKVLEFGAANGRLTKYLSQEKKCIVDIVEIDSESGMEASQYARKAMLGKEDGDIEQYNWLELGEKYDYIVFADVLEHLVNPQKVLKCCKLLIKEDGKVLVSIPNIAHNSIIISLLKDSFFYNPVGLLDDTHLRFFTRTSFMQMVQNIGWAIVEEKAKYIRVGENEIQSSYDDVSKEIVKELINRDNGEVYQYLFVLTDSSKYLHGQCERKVSLDSCPFYYFAEAEYSNNSEFSWKKSVNKYINPKEKNIRIILSVIEGSTQAKIYPINCNSVLKINEIVLKYRNGKVKKSAYQHNGNEIGDYIWFFESKGELLVEIEEDVVELQVDINILNYDFDGEYNHVMYQILSEQKRKLNDSVAIYESKLEDKSRALQESSEIYENEIARMNKEFKESCKKYEDEIARMDKEYKSIIEEYQKKHRILKKGN